MLAHALEGDVSFEHDLVVLLREFLLEKVARVFAKSTEQFLVHAGHAVGSVLQPFAARIFADGEEYLFHRRPDAVVIDAAASRFLFRVRGCSPQSGQ